MRCDMFSSEFIKRLKNFITFFLIYTALFIFFYLTSKYTFPFIFAFTIAFIIQPVTRFFTVTLKFKKNMPALLVSVIVYILVFAMLALLFYCIVSEAAHLMKNLSASDIDLVIKPIRNMIVRVGHIFRNIDPFIAENYSSQFAVIVKSGLDIACKGLRAFLAIALSIPLWITVILVVILSTYFFTRDMSNIQQVLLSAFSANSRGRMEKLWNQSLKMLTQYIMAHFLICFLTFILTLIGFTILGIKYAATLSIIIAIADILPVIGIGLVYMPLAAIYILAGNYSVSAGVMALFILVSIVRQIIEPKIMSESLHIHPIAILASIFIGAESFGLIGVIYMILMMILYKMLKNTGIL